MRHTCSSHATSEGSSLGGMNTSVHDEVSVPPCEGVEREELPTFDEEMLETAESFSKPPVFIAGLHVGCMLDVRALIKHHTLQWKLTSLNLTHPRVRLRHRQGST